MDTTTLPPNPSREKYQRYLFLAAGLLVVLGIILARLITLQFGPQARDFALNLAKANQTYRYNERGIIYDRWGSVLANNQDVYEVGINPHHVQDATALSQALQTALGLAAEDIQTALDYSNSPLVRYVRVKGSVPKTEIQALASIFGAENASEGNIASLLAARGIEITAYSQRNYPQRTVASNLLGFVAFRSREENRAYFGIEEKYDAALGGQAQEVYPKYGQTLAEALPAAPSTADIVLSIDLEVQRNLEILIDEAARKAGAASGNALILNPQTGEVIALATTTRLDPNQYWTFPEVFPGAGAYNPIISSTYEPGGIFSVLTVATAFEQGVATPGTPFLDTGKIMVGGPTINNGDLIGRGSIQVKDCLVLKNYVCLSWLATQIGPSKFYEGLARFGIGKYTGIDLASEVQGMLTFPGDPNWYPVNLATNSFGQGLAVTPIQMASAFASILNGGKVLQPHLLSAVVEENRQYNNPVLVASSPISPQTARDVSQILAEAYTNPPNFRVSGYRVAAFSGTALQPSPTGYGSSPTELTLVGWGPVVDPQLLVYIWMSGCPNTDKCNTWAGWAASNSMRQSMEKFSIPPSE